MDRKGFRQMYNTKVKHLLKHLSKLQTPPKPKFEKGDIIVNRFKDKNIVSKVVHVQVFEGLDPFGEAYNRTDAELIGNYTLIDLVNEHKKNVRQKYSRTTFIAKIDAYYQKVRPETAQILYGIRVDEGDKK